jgi:Arc/MetJ family transcription regulator
VYDAGTVHRTNVVIDEELLQTVMRRYGLKSKRAAVDFALRRLVGDADPYELAKRLRGRGWGGDLTAMREGRPIETI